jgi:hypothetical protein
MLKSTISIPAKGLSKPSIDSVCRMWDQNYRASTNFPQRLLPSDFPDEDRLR